MATYGRNRQSIADIEQELHRIFDEHPKSHLNDAGEPVIPADSLVDVFRAFSDVYNGIELMTEQEIALLKNLLAGNPGLEVTPTILLQFVAEKTKHSPPRSPQSSPSDNDADLPGRGRAHDRDVTDGNSRSSSNDSAGTAAYTLSGSRPPSRGPPQTPAKGPSPFDTSRRQRSTPLGNNAPSSWTKRPTPAHRRKSDAGSRSDSESTSTSPTAFGRTPGRTRAPSNPTSPSSISSPLNFESFSLIGSPPLHGHISRPHSRARSQPQSHFTTKHIGYHYSSSPTDERAFSPTRNDSDSDNHNPLYDDSFLNSISSLPMPHNTDSDSDSDGDDDSALGLVLDRTATSSTASLEPIDRVDLLQRTNAEIGRKLLEAERTLQNKLTQHEIELEDMQSRLDEMRSELSATKREEKELRSKERQYSTQIGALELEVTKVTKALDHARSTYTSLQRQYQEQCAASEKYRDDLRQREELIRNLHEAASLHDVENAKWAKEHENYEERIAHLEEELSIAQQAHAQLDEQKQENLLLKETIDRMRFDMDEMRNSAATAVGGSSGQSSAANSISKSLGAELLGKMKGEWGIENSDEEDEGDTSTQGEDTEGEDVIQTIITRKKRKVPGRANRIETRTFEETKEYSDAYTQHEAAGFTASINTQTDPEPLILTTSFSIQTDEIAIDSLATQTDPPPIPIPRRTIDMEIQTDTFEVIEPEVSRSPSPSTQDDEAMASSSSTVSPPTPKPQTLDHLHPLDQPPAYNQINEQEQEERDWRVAAETLKKWHQGVKIPFEPIAGGISEETVEEWKALKEELGIECMVIDKVVASSEKTSQPRLPKDSKHHSTSRRGRFYNIYNTYVYGAGKSSSSAAAITNGVVSQVVLCIGASALVFLAMSPYMIPHYAVPGGPTYYDRTAWSSFNSMQAVGEGFSPDGTAVVWNFLGRVGGGAARIARGWPT